MGLAGWPGVVYMAMVAQRKTWGRTGGRRQGAGWLGRGMRSRRRLGTFRAGDSYSKETFIYHAAGARGPGFVGGILLRDREGTLTNPVSWAADAAGDARDERVYACSDFRGNVSALVSGAGTLVEQFRYSATGVPTGMPRGDVNGDGTVAGAVGGADYVKTDAARIAGIGSYSVEMDTDLSGQIDAADVSVVSAANGAKTGRGKLSAASVGWRVGSRGEDYLLGKWHLGSYVNDPYVTIRNIRCIIEMLLRFELCERDMQQQMHADPEMRGMLEELARRGCPAPAIQCVECGDGESGGYRPGDNTILICVGRGDKTITLKHELIHALYKCTSPHGYPQGSCAALACTEFRAAFFSGECAVNSSFWNPMLCKMGRVTNEASRIQCALSNAISSVCGNLAEGCRRNHPTWFVPPLFPGSMPACCNPEALLAAFMNDAVSCLGLPLIPARRLIPQPGAPEDFLTCGSCR